jgi:hypothetical protein
MSDITPIKPRVEVDPEILRRVLRWQEEQKRRKEKEQKRKQEAARKGISVKALAEQRRSKYLLKECRSTIWEIVAAHKEKS